LFLFRNQFGRRGFRISPDCEDLAFPNNTDAGKLLFLALEFGLLKLSGKVTTPVLHKP
jgi:hypothetical protein